MKLQSITGMAPPTNTLADLGCTNNQILKWDGDSWECAADAAGSGGVTALTGDVTASGTGSVAATIANNAVTNTKIANTTIVATDKLSATGTKNSTTFLRGDNTWAAPPSGGISTTTRLSCTGSCTVTCTAGWLRTGCGAAATNYLCYPNTANGCQGNGSGTCYAVCAQ
ncbi:MAG: hypothetical protein LRZ85_05405 [Alphaproteobacteria bacterium]|nr:hypothetical protein [Alphaproteobacteria bacterium]